MKHFCILLAGICNFSSIFLIEADGKLRGTNAEVIEDNQVRTSSKEPQHQTTIMTEFDVSPSMGSSTTGRTLKERKYHARIHGADDRRGFHDTSWPWRAVGKVRTEKGSCTGTLIGPKLMVTAQHCLNRNSDGSIGWLTFAPAYYDGQSPYGTANGKHAWWDHQVPQRNKLFHSEFAWDYAVVLLDRTFSTGYWGFKVYKPQWDGGSYWRHIGYGGDISSGQRPLYHHTASIQSVEPYATGGTNSMLMKHQMDSSKGHSGGPVFGFFKNDKGENMPYVVGVHVGGSFSGLASGGNGLNALIYKLRLKYK